MDIVCMALAGRAAEEIFFGGVTTGASDDLRRVTDLVYSTIQVYGMNPRLGQLAFPKDPNAMFDERPYSEKTAKAMDEEAKITVDEAYQRTLDLLREHKDDVESVAKLLLEKETITHDDILALVGERPFKGDPQYEEFIKRRKEIREDVVSSEQDKKQEQGQENDSKQDEGPLNPGLAFQRYRY
jgi:AFG3 family protein